MKCPICHPENPLEATSCSRYGFAFTLAVSAYKLPKGRANNHRGKLSYQANLYLSGLINPCRQRVATSPLTRRAIPAFSSHKRTVIRETGA